MQISAANLIAAQQAAQRALLEKSALAAKQAARTAPAFALPDLQAAAPVKTAASAAATAPAPQQAAPQPGARLGQHINIVV